MPGVISTVSVKLGQPVKAGDPLMSVEAMKMETQISAPRDGTVVALLVAVGAVVEPKDLLVELQVG
jgi:pyruvate carboxylase